MVLSMSFLVRVINEFVNQDKLRRLYVAIDEHWDIFTSDLEMQMLKDYSKLSRKFTKYYSILMYLMMTGFILMPLTPMFLDVVLPLNESRPRFLAIEVEFRVNKDEYFLPLFFYTTAISIVGLSIIIGVDTMHIMRTAHACSLFAAVSKQIKSIALKTDNNKFCKYEHHMNTTLDISNEEMVYQEYIKCLKKHQLAIEFSAKLESTYQGLSLVLLMLITSNISLIAIQIIYVLDQLKEVIRFTCVILAGLLILLIVCYSGQKLMDESQNVFYEAYATKWYDFSPRIKSLLIILLYRSNVSCRLKAGNMFPLSIATFAVVVRMGVSYFTAFLSLKD